MILQRATEIAARYSIIVRPEDGEFFGDVLEMPHTWGDGKTPEACIADTMEAAVGVVAYMLEEGEVPPPAATDGIRTEQVNVRLSADERVRLYDLATRSGFTGISDYMRVAALAGNLPASNGRKPPQRTKRSPAKTRRSTAART
jgi:predicted RNase H-like HicB family nuclease